MIHAVEPPPEFLDLAGSDHRQVTHRWHVEALSGSAGELHAAEVSARRLVRVNLVDAPAVVLGSSQSAEDLLGPVPDGVQVAHRRSGGGAVWLAPGEQVWVDVVVPVGDPLWVDDVSRSAHWLGSCWAGLGPAAAWVSDGPMVGQDAGAVACFAGRGPGEVMVGDNKLVGISQRRTSAWARFQCVGYLTWDPAPLVAVLGSDVAEVNDGLRSRVATIGSGYSGMPSVWDVVGRLVALLP